MNLHLIAHKMETLAKFLKNLRKWKLTAKDVAAELEILAHQVKAAAEKSEAKP